MPKLEIHYNPFVNKLWFWELGKLKMDKFPTSIMYCIEDVSEEMLEVLIAYWNNVDHQSTVWHMLYDILSQKAIHNT